MFGAVPTHLPQPITFYLLPKFSMMGFTSAIEPLRSANRMSGQSLYTWHIVSKDGKPVAASNGILVIPESGIDRVDRCETLILCAGLDVHLYRDKAVFAWLRRLDRQGADIGALSTGSHALARAGLLDGHRCTIHWEGHAAFREEFPQIEVTTELFEIDRNRFTCSGGTAALDLMLNLIALQHGHALAASVSDQFIHERIRAGHDHQRMSLPARLGIRHPKLIAVIRLMEENIEEPLSRARLARDADLSTRQLERLFRKYLQRTPTRHYLEIRLARARLLLQQTEMSVLDVALACGFVSASHFSKCYREFFALRPREERMTPTLPRRGALAEERA
jgi:transcriptional regulator GlxA family with amidase domain